MNTLYIGEPPFSIDPRTREYFIKKISRWGQSNFKNYPWRSEKNLFRLLLTEIFLQKTDSLKINNIYPLLKQIETPCDMLNREDILDQIVSRIGLKYKKGRILRLSRQIVDDYKGKIPVGFKELMRLMGVGNYIANAVMAFGYGKRTAVVDTNTIRIVESFFGYRSSKKRARDDRQINEIILWILPHRRYTIFNYYLLDFGAGVCVSSKKLCGECPLKRKCVYYITAHSIENGANKTL